LAKILIKSYQFVKCFVIELRGHFKKTTSAQNREKLALSSLVRKMSGLAQHPLSVRTHH